MPVPKQPVDIRYCENCGWIIPRRYYDRPSMYEKRKYCSRKCAGADIGKSLVRQTDNYWTLHWRVRVARGPAKNYHCTECGQQAYDWAMLRDTDGQNVNDYTPLCRKCHIAYDGTVEKKKITRSKRSYEWSAEKRAKHSETLKRVHATIPSEERSEARRRSWETRRRKKETSDDTQLG